MNLKYKGFTVFIPDKETISVSESAPTDVKKVIAQLSRTSLFDNEVLRGIIVEELHRRGMLFGVVVSSLWIVFFHAGKCKKSNMNKRNKNGKL